MFSTGRLESTIEKVVSDSVSEVPIFFHSKHFYCLTNLFHGIPRPKEIPYSSIITYLAS